MTTIYGLIALNTAVMIIVQVKKGLRSCQLRQMKKRHQQYLDQKREEEAREEAHSQVVKE